MLILTIFAPLAFIVLFFIIAFLFSSAYQKEDKVMMKFWGSILGVLLLLFIGSLWMFSPLFVGSGTIKRVTEKAIRLQQPHVCYQLPKEIPDTMPRYNCLVEVAIATKNTKICADDLKGRPELGFCYKEIAVKYKDVKVCDELRDLAGDYYPSTWDVIQCYINYASANYDWKVCEHLLDNDTKFTCYMYGGQKTACDSMRSIAAKDGCYRYFGICAKIEDSQIKKDCEFLNKRNS